MPVLEAEPQLFPDNLFDTEIVSEEDDSRQWCVLHTRPRAEKKLARVLHSKEISYFLPQGMARRKVQRRWVTTYKPLFPGYLFLLGTQQEYYDLLETKQVVTSLEVKDPLRLERELAQLHRLINQDLPLSAEPSLPEGAPVEIVKGSLAGLRGKVFRNDGVSRIIVEVKMINQGVSVQVEDWMLKKC